MPPALAKSAAGAEVDGRRLRSEESRRRIVAALLDLVRAGDLAPRAEAVADKAGVGLRSVFRHFNDMDTLHREMSEVIESEVRAIYAAPFKAEDEAGRLAEIIDRRARVFERILPFWRAGDVIRHRSPFLELDHATFAKRSRDLLKAALPSVAKNTPLTFEALDLTLSIDAYRRLREDQRLSAKRAREVVSHAAQALLAG